MPLQRVMESLTGKPSKPKSPEELAGIAMNITRYFGGKVETIQ